MNKIDDIQNIFVYKNKNTYFTLLSSKFMKPIKWWILAFFFGQILALWKKDKSFQKKLQKAPGVEKITTLFHELFSFNKELIDDGKKIKKPTQASLTKTAQAEWEKLQAKAMQEKEQLTQKIQEIQEEVKTKGPEVAHKYGDPIIEEMQTKAENIKKNLQSFAHDLDEKYQLMDNIDIIKKNLTKLANDLQKKNK